MAPKFVIALSLVALLCAGCIVVSVNPLHTDEVEEFEQSLIGTWHTYDPVFDEIGGAWTFRANKDSGYVVTANWRDLDRSMRETVYDVHLVHLGKLHFFDFFPRTPVKSVGLIRTHYFVRVELGEDEVRMASYDPRKIEEALRKEDVAFVHADGRILLTGSSEELQAFFAEHGEKLFGDVTTVLRKQPAAAVQR